MKTQRINIRLILPVFMALAALILTGARSVFGQGTAFTYQGRLQDGGTPANGSYDLRFMLYDALAGGKSISSAATNTAATVRDGLFSVPLDFGADVFTGANLWLEIGVRTNGAGSFTTLTPRQPITPAPYAIHAANATTATTANVASEAKTVLATNIAGIIGLAQLPGAVVTNNETSVTLGDLTLSGALHLPGGSAAGIVYSGGDTLMHSFGTNNFFAGSGAGNLNLSGRGNVGVGLNALHENTTGTNNTAIGAAALGVNTIGSFNTASGNQALAHNTKGTANTATGWGALLDNTSGINNTGHGMQTLRANTTGNNNTANGFDALWANTTGSNNTANGFNALVNNVVGSYNTASGATALQNSKGDNNTAMGYQALRDNLTGANNIAVGYQAGLYLTNRSGNIDIGNAGVAGDDNTIRIGTKNIQTQTFIAGIAGATAASGVAVYVDSSGHLGTLTSSARFKRNIQNMDDASVALFALKPVTFRYKSELDPQGIPQFGLVAEEVEKIDPDLVARDDKNQVYTVRYEAVNAMLLNEFLKQHRKVEEQNAELENLKKKSVEVETLKTQNDSLAKRLSQLEQIVQSLTTIK